VTGDLVIFQVVFETIFWTLHLPWLGYYLSGRGGNSRGSSEVFTLRYRGIVPRLGTRLELELKLRGLVKTNTRA